MKADAAPLLALFEKKARLEVPLFQRQYVWSREHQWEPLWEDICRKFSERLEGRLDAPVHFLSATQAENRRTNSLRLKANAGIPLKPLKMNRLRQSKAPNFFRFQIGPAWKMQKISEKGRKWLATMKSMWTNA